MRSSRVESACRERNTALPRPGHACIVALRRAYARAPSIARTSRISPFMPPSTAWR